jgi:hypothetical protein
LIPEDISLYSHLGDALSALGNHLQTYPLREAYPEQLKYPVPGNLKVPNSDFLKIFEVKIFI